MKIDTRFDVGDIVYYENENKIPEKCEIKQVHISENLANKSKSKTIIYYTIESMMSNDHKVEDKLFKTPIGIWKKQIKRHKESIEELKEEIKDYKIKETYNMADNV